MHTTLQLPLHLAQVFQNISPALKNLLSWVLSCFLPILIQLHSSLDGPVDRGVTMQVGVLGLHTGLACMLP